VLWVLEEMGVKADVKSLPFPGPRLQPDYLVVNPAGTVPAMVDGDPRHDRVAGDLRGPGRQARQHVSGGGARRSRGGAAPFLQWLWYGESTIMLPIGMIVARVERLKVPGPATDAIPGRCARETFTGRLAPLERRLEGPRLPGGGPADPGRHLGGLCPAHRDAVFGVRCRARARAPLLIASACAAGPAFIKAAAVR